MRPWTKTLLASLIGLDLLVLLLFVLAVLTGQNPQILKMLDLNGEANLPTWYASAKLLSAGFLLAIVATSRAAEGQKFKVIGFLALLLVGLSADETATLHEKFGFFASHFLKDLGLLSKSGAGMWPYLFGFPALLLFLVFAYYLLFDREMDAADKTMIIGGFSLIIVGALGFELLDRNGVARWFFGPAPFITLMEETVENIGGTVTLLACAILFAKNLPAVVHTLQRVERSERAHAQPVATPSRARSMSGSPTR